MLGEAGRQFCAQLARVHRLGEHLGGVRHHDIEVDAAEKWTVVAVGVELLGEHALGEWAQHEAIVGGHGVDRSALHDESHNAALEEQRLQFGGIEVDET